MKVSNEQRIFILKTNFEFLNEYDIVLCGEHYYLSLLNISILADFRHVAKSEPLLKFLNLSSVAVIL